MPCTTSSFTEMQMVAGYPWYPRKAGAAPRAAAPRAATRSSSAVETPGATAATTSSRTSCTMRLAARIRATSSAVLICTLSRTRSSSEPVRESPDRARRARREQCEARRPSIAGGYVREEQRSDAMRIVRRGEGRGFLHRLLTPGAEHDLGGGEDALRRPDALHLGHLPALLVEALQRPGLVRILLHAL